MSFVIEQNIPIPLKEGGHKKYPWDQLHVDCSLFIETELKSNRIYNSATQWAKRHNIHAEYSTRQVTENGKRGVRIWRTK